MKRLFDVCFSLSILVLLFPLLLLIAWWIKKEDDGDLLYRGTRVGRDGRIFKMYKFRTMVMNAEQIGGPSTSDDDFRITRAGKTLRKYKLDELPQMLNVLKGDMSIVGPRPEVPSEVETYSEEERRILLVRPGITDWASITFRNEGEILKGSPDPHEAYREKIKPKKIELALQYVDNVTAKNDLLILVRTIQAVLFDSGER